MEQFESCRQILDESFGVEPSQETVALVEQIQAGTYPQLKSSFSSISIPDIAPPSFLESDSPDYYQKNIFVGREGVLTSLSKSLQKSSYGEGQVIMVQGRAGEGKTALIHEFAGLAMELFPGLLVAFGTCNAFSGPGDPYLPFRDILAMLTGDMESGWLSGEVSRDHARILWQSMPKVVGTLINHAPLLLDALIPVIPLYSRCRLLDTERSTELQELQKYFLRENQKITDAQQIALLDQTVNFLKALSDHNPLLLIIDDMQWIDSASLNLFFHLGRNLDDKPILLLGTYRSENIRSLNTGDRHPLEEAIREFQYRFGEYWVDLSRFDPQVGRAFSDQLLDIRDNEFDDFFRQSFFERAGGQPFFTLELLRAMQEKGDLVQNQNGSWVPSPNIKWDLLPKRVEAVIENRIDLLNQECRDILSVASVIGERFFAQGIASILDLTLREVLGNLSQEIEAKHNLVLESGNTRVDDQVISNYSFVHSMFHTYIYDQLGEGERLHLHGEVARVLEQIFKGHLNEVVPQLAYHYALSMDLSKAAEFSLLAGDHAKSSFAYEESVAYYRKALSFLQDLPSIERFRGWYYKAVQGLGFSHYALGDTNQAENYLRDAIQQGENINIPAEEIARIYFRLCENLFWQSRYEEVISLANYALDQLEKEPDSTWPLLMEAMIGLAEHTTTGKFDRYRKYAYTIYPLLSQVPLVDEHSAIYSHVFEVLALDRDEVGAWELLQNLEEKARASHHSRMLARAVWNRGILSYLTGDLGESIKQTKAGSDQFKRIGDAIHECLSLYWLERALLLSGELLESTKIANRMFNRVKSLDLKYIKALANSLVGSLHLAHNRPKDALKYIQKAYEISKFTQSTSQVWFCFLLGKVLEGIGADKEAIERYQAAALLKRPEDFFLPFYILPYTLHCLENLMSDQATFEAFCDKLAIDIPDTKDRISSQWYLEPVTTPTPQEIYFEDSFRDDLLEGWTWVDPRQDCDYKIDNGLQIQAANARDLWFLNQTAPRLLRPLKLNAACTGSVQVHSQPGPYDPTIGGLILWLNTDNYFLLDRGLSGLSEINFRGYIDGQALFIGRGNLPGITNGEIILHLSWNKMHLQAFCSVGGEKWYRVGEIKIPKQGDWLIGMHCIGSIERVIYPDAGHLGSSILFDQFQLCFGVE